MAKKAPVLVAALILSTGLVSQWEGKRNDPYIDLAGIPTVCFGETNVAMRHYTDDQCKSMLQKSLQGYQKEVLLCTPQLADRPYQLAAVTSLAYNIGSKKYCASTTAKYMKVRDWKRGCSNMLAWVNVKGKRNQGLVNRRNTEYKVCITNV